MDKRLLDYLKTRIPFNKPHLTHKEMGYISHANKLGQLSGDGFYTQRCHDWLKKNLGTKKALLTHSGTGALEMMAILANIGVGDEVIMPSFTFPSTANAVILRRGVPVFIDVRKDTLNMDEKLVEQAITSKTKALFTVHYAGVACEMDKLKEISRKHKLVILEDAAQGFMAKYRGKYLGTIGDMGAYSFHETKNIISGEGGAILLNKSNYIKRAEIIREKGTNRSQFFRGQVDKYTWMDIGSSYLPGEIIAAFLMAQLEHAKDITNKRVKIWNSYHKQLKDLEDKGYLRRPIVPKTCEHSGHLYYILVDNLKVRNRLITFLKKKNILAIFHYIPLHNSPAGKKYARSTGKMTITNQTSNTLLRLPLFYDVANEEIEYVIKSVYDFYKK